MNRRARLLILACFSIQLLVAPLRADEQPPFNVTDPASSENFRNIYLAVDHLSLITQLLTYTFTGAVNLLCVDSPTLCVDAVNNRVGIGIAAPIKVLDIRGASDGLLLLAPTDDVGPSLDIFQITNAALSNVFSIAKSGAFITRANSSQIVASGESKFTIEADAASQSATLQLNTHNATTGQCTIYMGDGSSATKGKVNYDPSTNIYQIDTNSTQRFAISSGDFLLGPGTSNNQPITSLKFTTDSGGVRYASIMGSRGSDAANIDLKFFTMAGDTGGILQRMIIMNTGDVRIGSSVDQQNLYVTSSGGAEFRVLASGSSAVYVQTQSNHPLYFTTNNGVNSIEITTSHNVNIRGTATNDAAAAGFVGENKTATGSAVSAATTNQYGDLTSLSLTAGDWMVTGNCILVTNSATFNATSQIGLSSTSGNSSAGTTLGYSLMYMNTPSGGVATITNGSVGPVRFSLASTTTVYFKMLTNYSAGTPQWYGTISALRVR